MFRTSAARPQAAVVTMVVATVFLSGAVAGAAEPVAHPKPNIVFILADDLGWGDLGCYGQKAILSPNLDRLAAEGMRFTRCYAGSTVCAPSRCVLMTGLHTGHCRIRGNAQFPLRPEDTTVAEVLKGAGYATALVGKWGLGEDGSTGVPNEQGFDRFFGYLNQVHAHNYYPDFLWRDKTKSALPGNEVIKGVAVKRAVYSADLFAEEALRFVRDSKDKPFFLYLALTAPHANNEAGKEGMEVPTDAPYSDKPWPQAQKNHAAMITRMDADLGRLFDEIKKLGLDGKTYIFFTSDNGPHREGGNDPEFHKSSGPLRGIKRALYEGGIRVPMIVRRPGTVPAGKVSDRVTAFWDVMPTLAEIAGAEPPTTDGKSMLPTLLGKDGPTHEQLYWEFHEGGFKQAMLRGDWKAIRLKVGGRTELYNLKDDPGETTDLADKHPAIVRDLEERLKTARTESSEWPIRAGPAPKTKAKKS